MADQQHLLLRLLLLVLLLLICVQGTCSATAATDAHALNFEKAYAGYLDVLKAPQLLTAAKTYQRLMAHKHSLSEGQLARSLVYTGANLRLRRVLNKLLAGKSVSVGVIGGSISWGHAVNKGVEDWFSVFSGWMNSTFPESKLTFKNGCIPATLSEYVSMCLKQFVRSDVDLVFVEYVTNDGYHDGDINNGPVKSFERLLRKLLDFQNAPAVCLMEFLATGVRRNSVPFWATAEDQYGVLAQYYGLPWLSFRNAVWQGLLADRPGFSRLQLFPLDEAEERHPTALGHRYMADMAIHLIQQTYMDSLLSWLDDKVLLKHPLAKVPLPMFPGNFQSSNLACIIGQQLPEVVVENNYFSWVNEGTLGKPKWGFVTWQTGASLVLKVDTRATVPEAEATAAATAHAGVAPLSPLRSGNKIISQGNTAVNSKEAARGSLASAGLQDRLPAHDTAVDESTDMIIWVGYVKSWKDMGTATISCLKGCSCAPVAVDGLHELSNTQQFMAKLYATQAAECLVEVKVNEWARQKQHKFKVTGIMVTHRIDYTNFGDYTDSVLLDALTN